MATIGYRENANELENLYRGVITPADRFAFSRVRVKKTIFSKTRKKGITARSLIPEAKVIYSNFPVGLQNDWKQMYKKFFRSGWNAFLKAYCERKAHGLNTIPQPNLFYLGKVGNIHIEAPANRCHIKQDHPNYYYVMHKKKGTKSQYDPVFVSEFASFPIFFELSYKTNLVALDTDWHARVYVRVYTTYQGRTLEKDFIFPFNLSQDWNRPNMIIEKPLGDFKGYEMHIDLYNVRGDLFLDNLVIEHNGKNWARDPHFNNMRTTFTQKYFQVASHYDIIDLPNGASFDTVYFED